MPYKFAFDQARNARYHYDGNREKVKQRSKLFNKQARARNKAIVHQYLLSHPCVDCGESDPVVLEFDHVRGTKNDNISKMISTPVSVRKLMGEIDKCDVRCANCHRRATHTRCVVKEYEAEWLF